MNARALCLGVLAIGCNGGTGGSGDLDPAACYASIFSDYDKEPGTGDVFQGCMEEPQSLVGMPEADVLRCAGQPCYSATDRYTSHVTTGWQLYCGGAFCSYICAPSVRVFYENGVVKYVRVRHTEAEPLPY